jgi:predicted Na+-dependent transporter
MELILMLLLPFPLGFMMRERLAAIVAYVAAFSFVFTFQTMTLLRAWVGGDRSAFAADPNSLEWSYAVVNVTFLLIGLGLVALGHRLGSRRRARSVDGVAPVHGDALARDEA